ncbi:MAG: sigma factor-like helix-turn-helix DNA-binding protein [Tissierellia bacterium]|nr:sigma factor-like helix-turn-helix DNA-binding protein [Tissierellia bacterium]
MEKIIQVGILFSYYENLLNEKQRQVINRYYNEDLSLNEIAALSGKTKQAVSDMINRTVSKLYKYEEELSLVKKTREYSNNLINLKAMVEGDFSKEEILTEISRMIDNI